MPEPLLPSSDKRIGVREQEYDGNVAGGQTPSSWSEIAGYIEMELLRT